MKNITNLTLNKTSLSSSTNIINYKVLGEEGAVFSVQVKDSSSPNKFYNFETKAFTDAHISENTLSNQVLGTGPYEGSINIPAASNGAEYRFFVFPMVHFDTLVENASTPYPLTVDITQDKDVTVRFSTSTDQTAESFVGVGAFTNSTTGSSNTVSNIITNVSEYTIADSGDGLSLGYKFSYNVNQRIYNFLQDSLQPIDSDFFTKVSTQTDGSGTDSTSMILDSVDNLVIGMSLVSIADSSDLEQSGTLGVLTYPTITEVDIDTKTVTLSAAPDWGDNKAVVFRAYGSNLIARSTGGAFEFSNFKVYPTNAAGNRIDNYGKVSVNGAVSGSTSIAIDGISGVSVGSRIFGASVSQVSNANLVTAVHSSGTPITVTGNQTLADNTGLFVFGSSAYAEIDGTIKIKTFPSASTDIYLDIDRAFVLATNS